MPAPQDTHDQPPQRRVLVVDDEPSIVDAVATALRYEGYDVREAGTGRQALAEMERFQPDLVVLDVMLPDLDGFEINRRIRRGGAPTAVLFLTARDTVPDKVRALRDGGDDYVTKPFSLAELMARVDAVLRRTSTPGSDDADDEWVLRHADVELDQHRHEVTRGGSPITLTAKEFDLLRYLMLNPRRVLSKAQILDEVWQFDFGGNGNPVETYVSYLRRKLGDPQLIKTVRLAGYMLDDPEA
jgi:two-component system OmpR family response regulator